jgi:hypothetical protein
VIAGTATAVAGGVANRQAAKNAPAPAPAPEPAPVAAAPAPAVEAAPAPAGGLSDAAIAQLTQLGELNKQGILTDEEFAAQKAKLLG